MRYDLIALDLDDTLLDSEKNISAKNRKAIERAQEAGVRVIIATGRAYNGLIRFAEDLGIRDYILMVGGALITDPSGTIIRRNLLPAPDAHQILEWAADRRAYFQVYNDRGFEYLNRSPWTDYYEKRVGLQGARNPRLLEEKNIHPAKILLVDDPKTIQVFKKDFERSFPNLRAETSEPTYLEIMSADASKGSALGWLADSLGIPRERVAAFGDSGIDVTMIDYAGLGIAVANAVPEAKQVADVIAPSCDEDGVAWGIEKYILN